MKRFTTLPLPSVSTLKSQWAHSAFAHSLWAELLPALTVQRPVMSSLKPSPPRMLLWFALTLCLMTLALVVREEWPQALLAVTLYKAHLMALGGWGGYWLDRALFPYDRPHTHLDFERWKDDIPPGDPKEDGAYLQVSTYAFSLGMLRRALIVVGCLICVGLGA